MTRSLPRRRAAILIAGAVALAVGVPVLAAAPSEPPGQAKQDKAEKGPEIETTVTGTVEQGTDEKGRPTFTMTVDGTVWELSAGPKWFWGDNNPLSAYAGTAVEITGTYREGGTDLDIETVNGEPLSAEGRPPWAGGPREVGESHPGWKDWMSEGKPGKGHGPEDAPGQNKPTPSDDPG
jgi:hypothetical protein